MAMTLTSPAFAHGDPIPVRCTGEGADVSPPLSWQGVPAGAATLALIADDPDAPDPAAPRRTWVHWVVADLPASVSVLSEGASRASMPAGAVEGRNDSGGIGYEGPYPPVGRHRYFFRLYALDTRLGLPEGTTRADVERAMEGHVLATAELMGTYQLGARG